LYNNASATRNTPFGEMPDEDWYFTIDDELHVVYHPTRAAWPHLIARGGGVILNMASISASFGAMFVEQAPHGAAKGAVLALTKAPVRGRRQARHPGERDLARPDQDAGHRAIRR
jgi:meso-butanediol dehydrogenase / (S,S)-butanediol dehydrogenase / diacetyl reductase